MADRVPAGKISTSVVNTLMKGLRSKRVGLPTLILVSLRNHDPVEHLGESDDGLRFRLCDKRLHVVDGQHRVGPSFVLSKRTPTSGPILQLPFVSILGASERDEIRQFYEEHPPRKNPREGIGYRNSAARRPWQQPGPSSWVRFEPSWWGQLELTYSPEAVACGSSADNPACDAVPQLLGDDGSKGTDRACW